MMEYEQVKSESVPQSNVKMSIREITETPIKNIIKDTLQKKNNFNLIIKDSQPILQSPIATFYSRPIVLNKSPKKILTKIIRYDHRPSISQNSKQPQRGNYEIQKSDALEITNNNIHKQLSISTNNFEFCSMNTTHLEEKSNNTTLNSNRDKKKKLNINPRNRYDDSDSNHYISKSTNNVQSKKEYKVRPLRNINKKYKNLSKYILNTNNSNIKKISLEQIVNEAKWINKKKVKKYITVSRDQVTMSNSVLNKSSLINKNKVSTIVSSSNKSSVSNSLMLQKSNSQSGGVVQKNSQIYIKLTNK